MLLRLVLRTLARPRCVCLVAESDIRLVVVNFFSLGIVTRSVEEWRVLGIKATGVFFFVFLFCFGEYTYVHYVHYTILGA